MAFQSEFAGVADAAADKTHPDTAVADTPCKSFGTAGCIDRNMLAAGAGTVLRVVVGIGTLAVGFHAGTALTMTAVETADGSNYGNAAPGCWDSVAVCNNHHRTLVAIDQNPSVRFCFLICCDISHLKRRTVQRH